MKDVLVSCEALHSGQDPHDSRGVLRWAPVTGPGGKAPAVSPESSGGRNWKSWGLRRCDFSHVTAQRATHSKAHHPVIKVVASRVGRAHEEGMGLPLQTRSLGMLRERSSRNPAQSPDSPEATPLTQSVF